MGTPDRPAGRESRFVRKVAGTDPVGVECYANLACIRVVGPPVPQDGERSRTHRRFGETLAHRRQHSVGIWAVGVQDGLSTTELMTVVFPAESCGRVDQPVFQSEYCLPL